jgi:hypothetical protein
VTFFVLLVVLQDQVVHIQAAVAVQVDCFTLLLNL